MFGQARLEIHASANGSFLGDGSFDYPTRTIAGAQRLVRERRVPGQEAIIWLHSGVFRVTEPIRFTMQDSGTTLAAWPQNDGEVVIDGSVTVAGWSRDSLRGYEIWTATAPAGTGRSIYRDGRLERPRLPREGYFRVAHQEGLDLKADINSHLFDGTDYFTFEEGDIPELLDPHGAEIVVPHFWIQERMPIAAIDMESRTVTSSYRTMLALRDGAAQRYSRYFVEGVADVLGEVPGQWYFDQTGRIATANNPHGSSQPTVFYVPTEDDVLEEFMVTVPVTGQLMTIAGDGDSQEPACNIRCEGITFRYADWDIAPSAHPPFQMREDPFLSPSTDYASDPQAASTVPGAIEFTSARACVLLNCTVEHVGGYAIRLGSGSQGILISGCTLRDLGAGGISSGGADNPHSPLFNKSNEISDNTIHSGGRTYPHAVAILLRHGSHQVVSHNVIYDFYSSAIACGWRWDYGLSPSTDNLIEGNHLHSLGQGRLDWFGAIYTLGVSPGTVIRGNLIHDIEAASFGGWGLLLDPSSSHIVVERNIIHSVSSECLHIKTGRENTIRNNIFARGGQGLVSLAIPENHVSATLTQNVLLSSGTPAFVGTIGSGTVTAASLRSDLNLIWDELGDTMLAGDGDYDVSGAWKTTECLDQQWRSAGRDTHSQSADPELAFHNDGTLAKVGIGPDTIGFQAIDMRFVGPRPESMRRHPGCVRTQPYSPWTGEVTS